MNTLQISNALSNDASTQLYFKGVYAEDRLPMYITFRHPALFIANTNLAADRGEHWVLFWFYDEEDEGGHCGDFMDSYRLHPGFYSARFEQFLHKHLRRTNNNTVAVSWNDKCVQAIDSDTCGLWCLYAAYYLTRGVPCDELFVTFDNPR